MTMPLLKGATRRKSVGLNKFPKRHLLLATCVAAGSLGLMALLPSAQVEAKRTEIVLDIDGMQPAAPREAILAATATPKEAESQRLAREKAERLLAEEKALGSWHSVSIQPGDNLSTIFSNQGLSARIVYDVSRAPEHGKRLADVRPGQSLEFRINDQGELTQFRYVQSRLNSLFFEKRANGYTAKAVQLEPEIRTAYAEASIANSLFLASQGAGLTDRMTMELAGIFGWDIDFALDIRGGDSFNVIYEEKFLDGEKLGNGNILAATFTNRGNTYTTLRYTDSKGDSGYFSPDGRSMRKAFLRTPVEFTRISSRFNPNRLHPVFKTKRPHRGVDYAAPTGTPIKASGDGRIKFSGWQNGFGNVVYIEHPNNIVTIYAHQSRLNKRFKKGNRVRQGDIVGYVGQTGWATGPHLHYEFRVNGVHRNPMTVKLPDASPIPENEKARFQKETNNLLAVLDRMQGTVVASQ
ncbi:MAG: OapA family protein [Endozoicomonas sp.]